MVEYTQLLSELCNWAGEHDIRVREEVLKPHQAGTFDGVSVTLNHDYPAEERVYYLVHSLGSIVRWSLSKDAVQAMFDELRSAKENRDDRARLEVAIQAYRAFETESSEFAVGLLTDL